MAERGESEDEHRGSQAGDRPGRARDDRRARRPGSHRLPHRQGSRHHLRRPLLPLREPPGHPAGRPGRGLRSRCSTASGHHPAADPVQRIREICENHAEKVRDQDQTSHAHLFLEFVASAPEEGLREASARRSSPPPRTWRRSSRSCSSRAGCAADVDPELIAWLIAGWAWTGDVASSMGVNDIWYERVSPRLIDFILGSLTGETAAAGGAGAAPGAARWRSPRSTGCPTGRSSPSKRRRTY